MELPGSTKELSFFFSPSEPNQTVHTGWKAWRCSQSCLGEVDEPRRGSGSRIRTHDRAPGALHQAQKSRSRGLAWAKIRQPKKPFPSLPCFWSGRRAWDASFSKDYPPALSFSTQLLLTIFSPFIHAVGAVSHCTHRTAG